MGQERVEYMLNQISQSLMTLNGFMRGIQNELAGIRNEIANLKSD